MESFSFFPLISTSILLLLICFWYFYLFPKNELFNPKKIVNNFRNMQRIFPVNHITRSPQPYQLPEKLIDLKITYKFNGETQEMSEFLQRSGTTGILVIKNDIIVYEKYFQGNSSTDLVTSWSIAKSIISALIGIALEEGKIENINDPITKYLPELKTSGYNQVPIKHILQMSSGVKFIEDYDDKNSDIRKLLPQVYLYMRPMEKIITTFPSQSPSGAYFDYISINSQVLAILIKRVTGEKVSSYFQKKIWHPIGAESNAYWVTDNYGTELGFCGFNATLRDYAKFGLLYLNNGKFNGQQIIPKTWVKESTFPDSPHLKPGETNDKYGRWGYQYQWWTPTNSHGDYSAKGAWGQFLYINPNQNLVIVKTSVSNSFFSLEEQNETIALFRAIGEQLTINNYRQQTKERQGA